MHKVDGAATQGETRGGPVLLEVLLVGHQALGMKRTITACTITGAVADAIADAAAGGIVVAVGVGVRLCHLEGGSGRRGRVGARG